MASWRVVITDFTESKHDIEAQVFADSGLDIDLITPAEAGARGLRAVTADADALLVQFATIDRALIESLTSCRVISRYGIGVDMIDLDAASACGIPVANVPDFCIDEVSTQAIGFLIDLNRRTLGLNAHVHSGRWGSPLPFSAPRRLRGQTLGIVGLGAIGRQVASKAAALGLAVLAHDPYLKPGTVANVTLVSLPELLEGSDYVSLHCPLTESTRGLIGEPELTRMKRTAYLLNLSRGPVVDQDALLRALASGEIGGAALDVLVTEPPATDDPILQMDNVIMTPHTASWSVESAQKLRRDAAQSVVAALMGQEPRSVVNRDQLRR